jgi:histone chaperone ASF1
MEMGGVETGQGDDKAKPAGDVDEDEVSDDGSVDIEGESEDELEEDELAEGEAMDEDAMEVDANDKSANNGAPQTQPVEVKSH